MLAQNIVRKAVAFIGEKKEDGFVPRGTAFIVRVGGKGSNTFYLATARHVIAAMDERGKEIHIRFNKEGGGTATASAPFENWHFHPNSSSEAVDVAVLPIKLKRDETIFAMIAIPGGCLTDEIASTVQVGVGDEIVIAGLFTNHHGNAKNIPVVRIGNIALMPDKEEKVKTTKLGGSIEAYLIEAHSIGGLSGSPVFVHFPPFRFLKKERQAIANPVTVLLGIMHGHFDGLNDQDFVADKGREGINTGMGVVTPVSKLIETLDALDHKALVERAVAIDPEPEEAPS